MKLFTSVISAAALSAGILQGVLPAHAEDFYQSNDIMINGKPATGPEHNQKKSASSLSSDVFINGAPAKICTSGSGNVFINGSPACF